jgi:beta-phosphoglucomutase-like phosphatase (HAD superfamily)
MGVDQQPAAGDGGAGLVHRPLVRLEPAHHLTMHTAAAGRCQLLIFDCDGVLVDSERICLQVLADMLAEHGVTITLEEAVARFIGASTARCAEQLDDLLGHGTAAHFMPRFAVRTQAAFSAGLRVVDGVPELLSTLATLALPYCVASNGNHAKMDFTLTHTGLQPLFEGRRYSATDVALPKPAPDLFLHAASCMAVPPARCVVVEDTPTGITAARAAGMWALGFAAMTPAHQLHAAGAHQVFTQMAELPALLWAGSEARP